MRNRMNLTLAAAAVAAVSIAGVAVAAAPERESRQTLRADANAEQGRAVAPGIGQPGAMAGGGDARTGMQGMAGMQVRDEFDYLTKMIPHHEEAIASAQVLAARTQREDIRAFADSIISSQTAEVGQMQTWLKAWYPGRDTDVEYDPMMGDLSGLSGPELDRAFLTDMIPHHGMAVMMSQQLLGSELGEHDDIVPFARNIRDTQRSEIMMMMGWLRDGAGPLAGHGGAGRAPAPGAHTPGDDAHAGGEAQSESVQPEGRPERPPARSGVRNPGGMGPGGHSGPGAHGG